MIENDFAYLKVSARTNLSDYRKITLDVSKIVEKNEYSMDSDNLMLHHR